jgi:hypothetical protein
MSNGITLGDLMKHKLLAAVALTACLLGTVPAYGAALPTISFTTALASPGSTGSIEVLLTNSSLSSIVVAGFGFEVTTANPDITFTSADFSTIAAYIFAGNSFDINNAFTLYTSLSPLIASDLADSGLGTTLAPGAVVGLGRILFAVSSNAAQGGFAIQLTPDPGTSLSDAVGAPIPAALVDGEITIASAPEPATLGLFFGGVALLFFRRRK